MAISIVIGIIAGAVRMPLLVSIYSLALLLPSIAVAIRRMHDVGKSGWFMLIPFYNLYLILQPSQDGSNQYGGNDGDDGDGLAEYLVD